ncbi:hypothetical protein PYCC9005_003155 [Savitreella phatthalungensis]
MRSLIEVVEDLVRRLPEREHACKELAGLLLTSCPAPLVLLHGLRQTGKTSIAHALRASLEVRSSPLLLVYIDCRECYSLRSLHERILEDLRTAILVHELGVLEDAPEADAAVYIAPGPEVVAETLDTFAYKLDMLLELEEAVAKRLVLVLDHFTSARFPDAAGILRTLHTAFARPPRSRMHKAQDDDDGPSLMNPQWSTLVITGDLADRQLQLIRVPSVNLAPYTSEQVLSIVQRQGSILPPIRVVEEENMSGHEKPTQKDALDDQDVILSEEETLALYTRFAKLLCSAYWDRLGPSNVSLFKRLAVRLWPIYIEPVEQARIGPTNHVQLGKIAGARGLWQDEAWLLEMVSVGHPAPDPGPIVGIGWTYVASSPSAGDSTQKPTTSVAPTLAQAAQISRQKDEDAKQALQRQLSQAAAKSRDAELSVTAKFLLIASYLASYNPTRTDRTFFSRGRDGPSSKRRRGGRGRGRGGNAAGSMGDKLPQRVLGAKAFGLERMMSIFQAIAPLSLTAPIEYEGDAVSDDQAAIALENRRAAHSVKLDAQLATLASLRLIIKSASGGPLAANLDPLDDGKWLCNVSFDVVFVLARSVNFELMKYMSE